MLRCGVTSVKDVRTWLDQRGLAKPSETTTEAGTLLVLRDGPERYELLFRDGALLSGTRTLPSAEHLREEICMPAPIRPQDVPFPEQNR